MSTETQAPDPAPLSVTVATALRRAFNLGQTYWQQADSDSFSQNAKSDITRGKFNELLEETTAAVAAIPAPEGALAEVAAFLDGSGPLEGLWFGEPHPTKKGAFWWRTNLRAALAAPAPQAPAWQPIETAPKDGTNVLLVNRKGNMAAGLWMDSLSGSGWYLRGGSLRPDTFFNDHHGPTHWMPLPAAPQTKEPTNDR